MPRPTRPISSRASGSGSTSTTPSRGSARHPAGRACSRSTTWRPSRRPSRCGSVRYPVCPRDLRVPARAVLGGALEGLEVDVDEPEALGVAEGPLEVVQQRPHEVAAQVDALADRAVGRAEVPVEVLDADRVVDLAVVALLVGDGGAVLGDVERYAGVVAADPREELVEALGIVLP